VAAPRCGIGRMAQNDEDPFGLFSGPKDSPVCSCIGDWKNERLTLRIAMDNGQLMLTSGKRELILRETRIDEWSVANLTQPDVELYIVQITGIGTGTRLTMRPGAHHKGSSKTAVLHRVEHSGLEEVNGQDGKRRDPSREDAGDSGGDERGKRKGGRKHKRGGGRRREDYDDRRSDYSRSASRRRDSRSRSRSPPRRGGGKGGGKSEGKDEDVTTIFVSGLPDDSREDEVRADLEVAGNIVKVVLMRRGSEVNAFIRFETVREANRAVEKILDGKLRVCGQSRVKAEMARRNTN